MSESVEDPNADQRAFWEEAGQGWARHHAALDAAFASVLERLLERAALRPGERVLDVGCGAGTSTLAAAEAVGPEGRVVALDVSPPLAALARARLAGVPQAEVRLADAQTAPPGEGFDAVISRFGVMFFADPAAAFANLGAALRRGGRIAFAAWAAPAENPWFALPRRAAEARLGEAPATPPGEPGPFAFALDGGGGALRAAGFEAVEVETARIGLRHRGDVGSLAGLMCAIGPAARLLRERGGGEADAAAVRADVEAALAPHAGAGEVVLPALIHLTRARRPA